MQCGYGESDITPEAGVFLAGNGEYKSEAIHDPLMARAAVLENSGTFAALVSVDLIGIELASVNAVRGLLLRAGNPVGNNVIISCTHTHNGPHTRFSKRQFEKHRDEKYLAVLSEKIADCIIRASSSLKDASMSFARGYAFENMNRRITTPDGKSHFYNTKLLSESPEIARRVNNVADPELDALQFYGPGGGVLLTAVHYAAHPLTVGIFSNSVSADFPGALVRNLEAKYKAPAVFFQGACGDVHPLGLFEGFERMEQMGRALAGEAVRILDACPGKMEKIPMAVSTSDIDLPVDARRRNGRGWSSLFGDYYRGEMWALSLGPLGFVTAPGEITGAGGMEIKWNSPFSQTWVLYNTNSYSCYISPRRYYREGGYEGETGQCLRPEAYGKVVGTALKLLEKVNAGAR